MSTTATKPPCPEPECSAPHVVRNGTLAGRQRYHCRGCGAWFGETHNTPMYRLRTPPQEIGQALLVVMRRGSLRAAEEVTGHKYETIGRWVVLAAEHAEALTEVLVKDLGLSTLEVDEFWSFIQRRTETPPQAIHQSEASAGVAWSRTERAVLSLLTPAASANKS